MLIYRLVKRFNDFDHLATYHLKIYFLTSLHLSFLVEFFESV